MWAIGGEQHKMHQDSTKLAVVLLQDQQVQIATDQLTTQCAMVMAN